MIDVEPLIVSSFERIFPQPEAEADWDGVLRRAGVRSRRYVVALALAAALVLAPAAWAITRAFEGTPAPPSVKSNFQLSNEMAAKFPKTFGRKFPKAIVSKAYGVIQVKTADGPLDLWAAPARGGGTCDFVGWQSDLNHAHAAGGGTCYPATAKLNNAQSSSSAHNLDFGTWGDYKHRNYKIVNGYAYGAATTVRVTLSKRSHEDAARSRAPVPGRVAPKHALAPTPEDRLGHHPKRARPDRRLLEESSRIRTPQAPRSSRDISEHSPRRAASCNRHQEDANSPPRYDKRSKHRRGRTHGIQDRRTWACAPERDRPRAVSAGTMVASALCRTRSTPDRNHVRLRPQDLERQQCVSRPGVDPPKSTRALRPARRVDHRRVRRALPLAGCPPFSRDLPVPNPRRRHRQRQGQRDQRPRELPAENHAPLTSNLRGHSGTLAQATVGVGAGPRARIADPHPRRCAPQRFGLPRTNRAAALDSTSPPRPGRASAPGPRAIPGRRCSL